jgi:hypothetical protein
VLAGADKSVDDILKKVVGTSRPNTSVIAPGERPLGKKALNKPSVISNQQGKKLAENKISTPCAIGKKSLEKPSTISKLQEEKLAKNKISTPLQQASKPLRNLVQPSQKQQEKKNVVNKTSKMPTTKRSKGNTKKNPWSMTNPRRFDRNTQKNPWSMVNPNYKFKKSLLSYDDLKNAAPCTRGLHTFYMQRVKSDDNSDIMVALRPRTSAWPKRDESSNGLEQIPVQLSDLYDLFNLDALDLTLLCCFILYVA